MDHDEGPALFDFKRKRPDDTPEIVISGKGASLSIYRDFALDAEEREITSLPVYDVVELDTPPCLLREPEVVVFNTVCRQRRNVGFFSNESEGYRYSGRMMASQRLPPWMAETMARVNAQLGTAFNGVLVNHYADGDSTIGAHSDDERALDKTTSAVAAISFGAVRKFRVRDKKTREIIMDVPTYQRSLMVMQGDFQTLYTHEVPVQRKIQEPRWSMTFRAHTT